ncbi:hypothetical protein AcW1_005393 [Taiwanofungus camphoratus]|nr:hypothetical protein AcW2_004159 [Antrodia cinnamomea]KAI0933610.1 hypothetical protein AcV5_005711 [Antrodia cinnamomea]KAI0948600.1 hypothetical protein AcV7_009295 [Antrodia cinnamomea]KAI0956801.1 hypothetical protein AcW1_005393 [Antrodia cinnamomea]
MSLNDKDTTPGGNNGVDLYPGVANPTTSSTHANPRSQFCNRPDIQRNRARAATLAEAARNFSKTAGVVEGRPGIIETSNIGPLNENSNINDGWG